MWSSGAHRPSPEAGVEECRTQTIDGESRPRKSFESDRKVLGRSRQFFKSRVENMVEKGIKAVLIVVIYPSQCFNEVSRTPSHSSFFSHNQTRIDANFHGRWTSSARS